MRDSTIAKNYAEVLVTLASKANDLPGWGRMMSELADAMDSNPTLRLFLESPRVAADTKSDVLGKALQDKMPLLLVRFLQALVRNRRQMLIPTITQQYLALVDEREGRMHARVTLAQPADAAQTSAIAAQLSRMFGKNVIPHVQVDPQIMGGIIVNVGDTVLDGSVRKRLATLRRRMLSSR